MQIDTIRYYQTLSRVCLDASTLRTGLYFAGSAAVGLSSVFSAAGVVDCLSSGHRSERKRAAVR